MKGKTVEEGEGREREARRGSSEGREKVRGRVRSESKEGEAR